MYGYGYSYPNNPQGSGLMGRYEAGVRSDGGSFAFPIDTGLASRLEGLGLLNASSLVNSCNAGKESVLYNLIPTPVQSLDRFAVTRSTVKWVLGANGVLQEIPANTPAFEFNTDGTYRGLLVEPAGTNLLLRSAEFDTTWAVADGATVTANSATSPDGTTTADTIALSTTASSRVQQSSLSLANSTTYTLSVFLKNIALASGETFQLRLNNAQVAPNNFVINATIDLFAGTVVYSQSGTAVTGISGTGSASIQNYGNGWYRISVTATTGTGAVSASSVVSLIQPSASAARSFYAWGAQLETGSVATSYIPTVASTQTRTADSVTLTGASSLIGQASGGAIYAEFQPRNTGVNNRQIVAISADVNNTARLNMDASGNIFFRSVVAGVGTTLFTTTVGNISTVTRLALAYKNLDSALFVNGIQVGSDNTTHSYSATPYALIGLASTISSTGVELNGWIRSVALFPSRLSNAQLASLTA